MTFANADQLKLFEGLSLVSDQKTSGRGFPKINYRSIVESFPDVIARFDQKQRLIYVNRAVEDISGFQQKDLLNKGLDEVISGKALLSLWREALSEVFETGREKAIRFETPMGIESRCFQSSLIPELGEDGAVVNVLVVCRDVTSLLNIQEKLKHTERLLLEAQKQQSIGALAGGVAHEFNNILCVITSSAQGLAQELKAEKSAVKRLEFISKAADRGTQIVRQLLNYARTNTNDFRPVALNTVVEDVTDVLRTFLGKKVQIATSLDSSIQLCNGDSNQIIQILVNLAINAKDAMPSGGTLEIRTSHFVVEETSADDLKLNPGGYVRLDVQDSGTGIPLEIQHQVFEPFFTTKTKGLGTGFGLSIVKEIMESHRGWISFESNAGSGTVFHLYFPVVDNPLPLVPVQEARALPRDVRRSGFMTVLYVDDEHLLRDIAADIFTRYGVKGLFAENAESGIELFKKNKDEIDAVVLDVVMPGLGGIYAYEEIRKAAPDMKILFSSGYAPGLEIEVLKAKANVDFLQKPFREKDLISKIFE